MGYAVPMMRELPRSERPREKLLLTGPAELPDRDLLALIIGNGTKSLSALAVADAMLARFESLARIADASIEELTTVPGVGEAKAARLCAAFEIGRRLAPLAAADRPKIRGVRDVVALMQGRLRYLDREELYAILLDTKHRVLECNRVSRGHLNGTLVHPREVFKPAIRRSSDAVIVVHNHPSGDPSPSPEDIAVTRRLVAAGRLLGIELLDHVILGHDDYVSLRQDGYIEAERPLDDATWGGG